MNSTVIAAGQLRQKTWRILRLITAIIIIAVPLIVLVATDSVSAAPHVFPSKTWQGRTPAEAGMDAAKLDAFAARVGGDGVIIQSGFLVKSWGNATARKDWASAAKPVLSTLLLLAVKEGRIKNVDALVKDAGWALADKDVTMTWRHLANMVSGYACVELPGAAWGYNDYGIQLYAKSLERIFGQKLDTAIRERLAPLQFEDGAIFGSRKELGVVASPRDFARIGWLWLNEGNWNGRTLIAKNLFTDHIKPGVAASLPRTNGKATDYMGIGTYGGGTDQTPHGPGVYGFNFWFNEQLGGAGARVWPALPADAYQANGMWNRDTVTVIPSLQMVVAVRGGKLGPFEPGKEYGESNMNLKLLVEACGPSPERNETSDTTRDLGHLGFVAKWRRVEISILGPDSESRGEPNPFAQIVDGVFTAPSGKHWKVPGFYDGNGKGGPDGAVWKVRFSADELGEWSFTSRSGEPTLNGWTAKFMVTAAPGDATGINRWGRLEAVGTAANEIRYLKFRDGPYWLKAGCDDPENFLGKSTNYDTNAERVAAIDYLSARGINSLYIMTHNLDGDDKDVWPWLGDTQKEAKANGGMNARFDIAKLAEWLEIFEHMQAKGMVTYIVLEDDSAWKGYDHARYYREIVARFAHLPGLIFNFNEEFNENYKLAEALTFMSVLKDLDAYNHPRGIHNVNQPDNAYVDAPHMDFTSIQTGSPGVRATGGLEHNQLVIDWIRRCRERNQRVFMVGVDEGRPEEERQPWWSAYLAGGVWEAHLTPPYDRPMSAWETLWIELGGTRAFMESLPFWEMHPANGIVRSGKAFCLAKPGAVYAFYLPEGGAMEIELPLGSYHAVWWNPTNGKDGQFESETPLSGGRQKLTCPRPGDWALKVAVSSSK